MRMRLGAIIISLTAVFAVLWLMWPSAINPVYWDEPEPPAMTGVLAPNAGLQSAQFIELDNQGAARSLALGADGKVYYGNLAGEILRIDANGIALDPAAITDLGDLPILDLAWINPNTLGATTPDGLFAINVRSGNSTRVSVGVPGYPFGYANDLAVTSQGEIYFTDPSVLLDSEASDRRQVLDMLENRPHGALYVWDPRTHQTRLAAERLYFPSGVAIASDERSIYVSETFRYRILRHWIEGPRRGETEVFASNLPGLPDGLATDNAGHLFVALPARRSSAMRTIRKNPWLARIVSRLPAWLRPVGGSARPFIAVLDEQSGAIIGSIHDPDDRVCHISNMVLTGDQDLWFGSSDCSYIARLPQSSVQAALQAPGTTGVATSD
ncbi:SMP-30/gluconolactonase/LRE family protein [Maricaulis sp.]|uniref:SMP-30/gluconolactonase/LRE family protein n=1 Tax=Maricaulis sp. TaxID=1486257 RepID=UPI002B27A2A5|nr:SMP-30/gluconolactonase/LRE family protein [Maricaulis sp.]